MDIILRCIKKSAITRAENADPHSGRCLVENCSRSQAVQVAHVYNRNTTASSEMAESLEWAMGMMKGTLNLDTRHNIFFLGAYLHELYKEKKWLLIPEKEMVFKYFDQKRLLPLKRPDFPQIQGDTFRYKFLPLQGMEDIYITRQSNDGPSKRVDVHHYPFDDLPLISSHIHPKYVILHLGETLRNLDDSLQDAFLEKYPWFEEVQDVCRKWRAILPGEFSKDTTFKRPSPTFPARSGSSGDGPCTPLHRIRPIRGQTPSPSLPYSVASDSCSGESSSSDSQPAPQHHAEKPSRKRRRADETDVPQQRDKKRLLTITALEMQEENDDLKSVKWTSERILGWAEGCPAAPAPLPLPSPSLRLPTLPSREKVPLRRSARLKDKLYTEFS